MKFYNITTGDNQIPVYGFRTQLLPFTEITSHCFALNSNFFDPEKSEIEKLWQHTKKHVKQCILMDALILDK